MSKKILIAEDEKPMAHALELKLKKEGFDVDVALDGEMALEKLATGKYDLMLLDLMMPRVDGFGVLEKIKKDGIKIKVIVSSNLSQKEDFDKAKALGAVDYFVKSNTSLVEVVGHVVKTLGK